MPVRSPYRSDGWLAGGLGGRTAVEMSLQEQAALAEEGQRVRAQLAAQVEALARQRWAQRAKDVTAAVEILERAAQATSADLTAVRSARTAQDAAAGLTVRPSRASRTRSGVTATEVVTLVTRGEDPYRILGLDTLGLTPPRIQRDSDPLRATGLHR